MRRTGLVVADGLVVTAGMRRTGLVVTAGMRRTGLVVAAGMRHVPVASRGVRALDADIR